MEMKYNYIAIEGTIGAGKTSLAQKIADEMNARFIPEQFEENSFLPKFYKNPSKYAFPLEMSFMASRFQQLKEELANMDMFKSFIVADYFLDKSLIFARKTLQNDEFALFSRFFNFINSGLPRPELILYLYLDIDRLKENIIKRGRPYEMDISKEYLARIQQGYFDYFRQLKGIRILVVNTNKIDFVANAHDYARLTSLLDQEYNEGIHRITLE